MRAHRHAQRTITVLRRTTIHHHQNILPLDTSESLATVLSERFQCYRSYRQFLTVPVTMPPARPPAICLSHRWRSPNQVWSTQAVHLLQPEVIVWKTAGMILTVCHSAPDGTTTRTGREMLSTGQDRDQQPYQMLPLKLFLLHTLCPEMHGTVHCEA